MAYDVTKTNGERLVIVPDRQLDTTTSIKLLGKNYPSYGEIMAENLVQMLENFSAPVPPARPIIGQLWYHAVEQVLYVNVTGAAGGWYPIGGKEIIGGVQTGLHTSSIKDQVGLFHPAIKVVVNGVVVMIISSDAGTYVPHADTGLESRFPVIGQGINMNDGDPSLDGSDYGNFKIRGRAMEAEFADMAEIYIADDFLVPGNLVKLGGNKEITKTQSEFDNQIFGVISTAPGFLLNSKQKLVEHAYPVALKGRVPCLVKGTVRKGQRIVASDIAGVGMATDHFDAATIIGRAIGEKNSDDVGAVEVAVGVR
jgi:hypothetical protein